MTKLASMHAAQGRWQLACFDLDGTLITGTTACQHLADTWLGHSTVMAELERRYAAFEISNLDVAIADGTYYAGRALADVERYLASVPRIAGISETLARLNAVSIPAILCTVGWKLAADCFRRWYGFAAVCGAEMEVDANGILTGRTPAAFDAEEKLRFVTSYCTERGIPLSACIAVGDGRSDIPLFRAVGYSIALNATPGLREVASVSVDSDDLRAILDVIPDLAPTPVAADGYGLVGRQPRAVHGRDP